MNQAQEQFGINAIITAMEIDHGRITKTEAGNRHVLVVGITISNGQQETRKAITAHVIVAPETGERGHSAALRDHGNQNNYEAIGGSYLSVKGRTAVIEGNSGSWGPLPIIIASSVSEQIHDALVANGIDVDGVSVPDTQFGIDPQKWPDFLLSK